MEEELTCSICKGPIDLDTLFVPNGDKLIVTCGKCRP